MDGVTVPNVDTHVAVSPKLRELLDNILRPVRIVNVDEMKKRNLLDRTGNSVQRKKVELRQSFINRHEREVAQSADDATKKQSEKIDEGGLTPKQQQLQSFFDDFVYDAKGTLSKAVMDNEIWKVRFAYLFDGVAVCSLEIININLERGSLPSCEMVLFMMDSLRTHDALQVQLIYRAVCTQAIKQGDTEYLKNFFALINENEIAIEQKIKNQVLHISLIAAHDIEVSEMIIREGAEITCSKEESFIMAQLCAGGRIEELEFILKKMRQAKSFYTEVVEDMEFEGTNIIFFAIKNFSALKTLFEYGITIHQNRARDVFLNTLSDKNFSSIDLIMERFPELLSDKVLQQVQDYFDKAKTPLSEEGRNKLSELVSLKAQKREHKDSGNSSGSDSESSKVVDSKVKISAIKQVKQMVNEQVQ